MSGLLQEMVRLLEVMKPMIKIHDDDKNSTL